MNTPDTKKLKDALALHVAKGLSEDGRRMMLDGNGFLTQEILDFVNALLLDRPDFVLSSPNCDKIAMLAGVGLGMALQRQNEEVEKAGGFKELTESLVKDGPEGVAQRMADSK